MSRTPNNLKYLLFTGAIDFENDVFNVILMQPGFVFNRETHEEYANVAGSELANAFGYNAGGEVLAGVTVAPDHGDNLAYVNWNNMQWTAAGGNLDMGGAIIYDDTVAGDPIVGYINFNGTITVVDGGTFTLANIFVALLDRRDLET